MGRADVVIVRRQSGIVIVKGDLAAGDLVVVEGTQRLREGAKVSDVSEAPTIVEDADEGGAPAAETPPAVSGGKPSQTPG